MKRREFIKTSLVAVLAGAPGFGPQSLLSETQKMTLENEHFSLVMDEATGALSSILVKRNQSELIGEKRLVANFRICLPLPDYPCHYIEGTAQKPVDVTRNADNSITTRFQEMQSEKGSFPVELSYIVRLEGGQVRFRSRLRNRTKHAISEFWFPRIGGWTNFGGRESLMAAPGYQNSCRHTVSFFKMFPGSKTLGAEAADYSLDYPGMTMPWWDIFDSKTDTGLYLGYHDKTFRYSTWHTYLWPNISGAPEDSWLRTDEAGGRPVGLVFSHVRYPFINAGETYESGEFILHVHQGDWHNGSRIYRDWFLANFSVDKSKSWLRKQSVWFNAGLLEPEGRVMADYKTYDRWCEDALKYDIKCYELVGWHKGGQDAEYPAYFPEEKLGGVEGYRALLASIRQRGTRCLTFINYNVIDASGKEYPQVKAYGQRDEFGQVPNRLYWGQSTLVARKGFGAHRNLISSVVPGFQQLLEERFLKLVEDGADGFQIDKVVAGSTLDFNPLNTRKPDEALCEGLVEALGNLLAKARKINPEFCMASEANQDRLLPYIDAFYRSAQGHEICPLRFVFPEFTAVRHVHAPQDFRAVNGAVMSSAVIGVEPEMYQETLAQPLYKDLAEYIQEVERIRRELADTIFLGDFFDDQGARVSEVLKAGSASAVFFAVHGNRSSGQRAIVVINESGAPRQYSWEFTHQTVAKVKLYAPFEEVREVAAGTKLTIPSCRMHVLVELL